MNRECFRGGIHAEACYSIEATSFLSGLGRSIAFAQEKNCECHFSEPPWEAYGTKAACTTWTRSSGQSCEIAFGGLGAEPDLVAEVLDRDPKEYFDEVYSTLQSYLAALQANDLNTLTDPQYLHRALPIFMRGAFLREPIDHGDAASLNALIADFIDTMSRDVSDVFRGNKDPFNYELDDAIFLIGKGWVGVQFNDTILITRYIPENGR